MGSAVLILRPQPGADATAARARAIGLEPVVAPLFTIRPVPWSAPDPAGYDAVLLTSANAARHAGPNLAAFHHLPCYAVGETTAAAAIGFDRIVTGSSDAAATIAKMVSDGARTALHPCGADRIEMEARGIRLDDQVVYSADAVDELPAAARDATVVLLHSPRAASLFAALRDRAGLDRARVTLAAISANAAAAAGSGWAQVHHAAEPRDQALLELVAKLCNIAGKPGQGSDD